MNLKHAKKLRSNMTDAEQRLCYRLRGNRFDGVKFKRQVPIGPFIVDFACMHRKLVLEIDGGQHSESETDKRRDQWLRAQGFHVLRFWNNDVLQQTNSMLEMIMAALNDRQPVSPSPGALRAPPSPLRGEGKKG